MPAPIRTALALLAAIPIGAAAQGVLVAPQAVILTNGATTGSFTVLNVGQDKVEIELSTLYGVPITDSLGRLFLKTSEVVPDSAPSASGWIEMFPARFILAAGARRTVRLLVTPPAGTPAREYWSRLVVASRAVPRSTPAPDPDAVAIAINLEVRSVFPFLYRHGAVATGIAMGEPIPTVTRDSIAVRVPLQRTGNAAWIGTLRMSVAGIDGRILREAELPLGVYYDLTPHLAVSSAELPAAGYRVTVVAVNHRTDLPRRFVLPAPSASRSFEVQRP